MAAAARRDAYNEIDQELRGLDTRMDAYDASRRNFIRNLRVSFDAWVDTLLNCPETQRPDLAEELGVNEQQLDDIIRKLRVISNRIQTNSDFNAEQTNIMNFISSYRNILAKIPGVPKPDSLTEEEKALARSSSSSSGSAASSSLPPPRFHFPLPSSGSAAAVSALAPPSGPPAPLASLASPSGPAVSLDTLASTGSPSSPASAAALPSDIPAAFSGLTEKQLAYLRNVNLGSKIALNIDGTGKPQRTVTGINMAKRDGKVFKVKAVVDGIPEETWVSANEIRVPTMSTSSFGGKSRRFKKTKKRRQRKSRKNKK